MPRIGYVWNQFENLDPKPMYYYWTQGVAVTEVELDVLTGDHHVLRTDIMMVRPVHPVTSLEVDTKQRDRTSETQSIPPSTMAKSKGLSSRAKVSLPSKNPSGIPRPAACRQLAQGRTKSQGSGTSLASST